MRLHPRVPAVLITAIVLMGLAASLARAGQDQWTLLHPLPGGTGPILGAVVAPDNSQSILVATARGGIYRSSDGGQTWSRRTTGLTTPDFWTLALSPNSGDVYAGSMGNGLFRSSDGGDTWTPADDGLTNLNVRAITFGPQLAVLGTSGGVFISDNGQTWRSAGPAGVDVSAVAVQSASPLTLVAGGDAGPTGQGAYLYRSTDSGRSWSIIARGLPADSIVTAISAGPAPPPPTSGNRALLVATQEGLFQSQDAGENWQEVTGIPAVDPHNPRPRSYNLAAYDPANPLAFYAGSDGVSGQGGGLWRTRDSGNTFDALSNGLPFTGFVALAQGRGNPLPLVAATYDIDAASGQLLSYSDSGVPPVAPSLPVTPTPSLSAPTPSPSSAPAHGAPPMFATADVLLVTGAALAVLVLTTLVFLVMRLFRRLTRRRSRPDPEQPRD
ncbi:MAG: WD40/YVTN/BNR-like repeat-containing protein [Candidatus Dormibacteria bacterium]